MKRCQISFLLISILFIGCARQELLYYTAPTQLPGTLREMKSAGFWISRHPAPDAIILDAEGIVAFNRRVRDELGLVEDLRLIPQNYAGFDLRSELNGYLKDYSEGHYYLSGGPPAGKGFYDLVSGNMNLDQIPNRLDIQYGLITHFADQRFFPTTELLLTKPFDADFDELQNSALDVGTPVVVLHVSRDGAWVYVVSPQSRGWVENHRVAMISRDDWTDFVNRQMGDAGFVVVTVAKADLYLQENLTGYYDYVRMGSVFPLLHLDDKRAEVLIPMRRNDGSAILQAGFIPREHIHVGYLPFTARHVFRQAFLLNNELYGWGGMYGEQDCSRLMLEVFSPFGIVLPRNSSAQARAGLPIARFDETSSVKEKLKVLEDVQRLGVAILPLRGHIMLYLGMVDERPYAIHATWAYREPDGQRDRIRVINRVAMTDLDLGEGSHKGSLLERMHSVLTFRN